MGPGGDLGWFFTPLLFLLVLPFWAFDEDEACDFTIMMHNDTRFRNDSSSMLYYLPLIVIFRDCSVFISASRVNSLTPPCLRQQIFEYTPFRILIPALSPAHGGSVLRWSKQPSDNKFSEVINDCNSLESDKSVTR